MKLLRSFFTVILFLMAFLFSTSCSGGKELNDSASRKVYAGSTPGDSLIKVMLSIPHEETVDFIRWKLTINQPKEKASSFVLNIVFGESQPNTLGFKEDHKKTFEGEFTSSENLIGNHQASLYRLKSPQFQQDISIIKINDHLLHLLTSDNQLMAGNGGYSYTLNYTGPLNNQDSTLTTYSDFTNDSTLQLIYEGRTPCEELAAEYGMNVSAECFKLKWRLILNRDPDSHQPTTYLMRKVVDNIPREVEGNWKVIRGITGHPNALIIQLDPDMPDKTMYLLAVDDNLLFFLRKDFHLFVGNKDFSFTLNRRK